MGTIWIREFSTGLDARRLSETTAGGALIKAVDCHINRGGEIEKRAAFVPTYSVPQTVGLAATPAGIVVFGHEAGVSVPAGVTYQRLAHPDGVTALSRVPSAELYAGKVYAVAVFADGSRYHYYDGVRVPDWFDGRARAVFTVTGGGSGGSVTSITVGGVNILGTAVSWTTDVNVTAAAIASQINATASTPEYTAVATANSVAIVASAAGTAANGLAVVFTTSGAMSLGGTAGLVMANGATTTGSFQPGTFAKTFGSKMYSVSGSAVHFSGVDQPTKWKTDTVGAGFIDMAKQTAGAEELVAIAKYQTFAALFAERTVVIEYFDVDPANNRLVQVLANTGTIAPRAVTQFGDSDVFYRDESGIRSLRARDSSNAAFTSDIGTAIDPLLTSNQQSLTFDERAAAVGLIEPGDGRFWLCEGDTIYVFSYFTGSKISAWSTYKPGFTVTDAAVFRRKVYARGDDNMIYVYGGLSDVAAYDAAQAEAWLPYLHGDQPTRLKHITGVDVACRGAWEIRLAMQPTNINASDKVATVTETTFNTQTIGALGASTHISMRFKSTNTGPAILSSAVIHFTADDEED